MWGVVGGCSGLWLARRVTGHLGTRGFNFDGHRALERAIWGDPMLEGFLLVDSLRGLGGELGTSGRGAQS